MKQQAKLKTRLATSVFLLESLLASVVSSKANAETTVALWQGSKKVAVSITFDDGLLSQFNDAFPILQQKNLKATFFLVEEYVKSSSADYVNEMQVLELAADGQEIGSHTLSHPHLKKLKSKDLREELSGSQSYLKTLTGQEVTTFAYPFGEYDQDIIDMTDDYYIAGRTAYPYALNASSPAFYELMVVGPHGPDGNADPTVYLQDSVDFALAGNEWVIEMFHSVGISGGYDAISSETFSTHTDYLIANEPNLWIAPMGVVTEYIYERNAASVTTLVQDSNSIQLDLQCGLDSRFNTSLTLLTEYPQDWGYGEILVKQGQTEQTADVVFRDGGYYIMYDAVPDAGSIELSLVSLFSFTISGHVMNPAGVPLPNVTLIADNGGGADMTDPNGFYELTVDYGWTGTVTPGKQDYDVTPESIAYTDIQANQVDDYTGRHITDLLADGVIDEYDLQILTANWLMGVPSGIDILDDGKMDLLDFSIFTVHWMEVAE